MNLLSLCMPPLLLSTELLHFLVAPPLFPLVLFPQLTLSLLLLRGEEKRRKTQDHNTKELSLLTHNVRKRVSTEILHPNAETF